MELVSNVAAFLLGMVVSTLLVTWVLLLGYAVWRVTSRDRSGS